MIRISHHSGIPHVVSYLAILFMVLFVSAAQWTDYYVSPLGDNSNAGTSPAKAWKTIGKVAQGEQKTGNTTMAMLRDFFLT